MDQGNVFDGNNHRVPLFDATRRGYDPEQVDDYLIDQQHRLDEVGRRAHEAEQRLGVAMNQIRAMNKRITDLEKRETPEAKVTQPAVPIDILGDRVQRILQEAWDGAFALRQSVENEVTELRKQAVGEAKSIVDDARAKARDIEEQMRSRRDGYLQRMEQDKARAVAQMTFLSDQRKAAIAELLQIKERIEAAIVDVPTHTAANLSLSKARVQSVDDLASETAAPSRAAAPTDEELLAARVIKRPHAAVPRAHENEPELPATLPVQMLPLMHVAPRPADTSSLVRSHRETTANNTSRRPTEREQQGGARVFDIEADDPE